MNFIIDPIQYYRRSDDRELFWQDRWQVASFIRNFEYDQIIVGTSMTQNFSLKFIQKLFHTFPIKLSIAGSTILEQTKVIQTAIQTGKVKSIIWGFDQGYLNYEEGKWPNEFPLDLYQQGVRGAMYYLWNWDITHRSLKYLLPKRLKRLSTHLEVYNVWHDQYVFSKSIVLNQYLQSQKRIQLKSSPRDIADLNSQFHLKCRNFNNDVVEVIRRHPHVKFLIFLPPYSLANYKLVYENTPESYNEYLKMRQYIFEKLCSLANVEIYDFETDIQVIAELNNYKDLTHYSKYINEYIALAIKQKRNIVNKSNINYYQKLFRSLPHENFK
ncbi:MAG: hypothetical protein IBJ00_06115 [Alphaproteobacteria bacterium]|nr:hypothetical protein [Alphaproteobacteria bacterium]